MVVVERYAQGPSRRPAISPSGESAVSFPCASTVPLYHFVPGYRKVEPAHAAVGSQGSPRLMCDVMPSPPLVLASAQFNRRDTGDHRLILMLEVAAMGAGFGLPATGYRKRDHKSLLIGGLVLGLLWTLAFVGVITP